MNINKTRSFKCEVNICLQFGDSTDNWYASGTNCAPLLVDLFLHAYDADFVEELLEIKANYPKHLISSFPCIDDVLSLTDSWFCDYLHLIYPNELEINDATDTQMSASYLDLHLEIGNGGILEI